MVIDYMITPKKETRTPFTHSLFVYIYMYNPDKSQWIPYVYK